MSEPLTPQSPPTVPAERTMPQPIKTGRIALYFFMGLCALVMLSNITHLSSGSSPKLPRSAQAVKPAATDPDFVTHFAQQQASDVAKLKQEVARFAATASADASPNPLPCDAAMAGARGTTPDGTPIVCGPDGMWHKSAATESGAPGAQPALTPAQQEAQGRKAEADKREQSALDSSTVAIDFSDQGPRAENAAKPDPQPAPDPAPTASPAPAKPRSDWFRYTGKLHKIFEGTILETVLTNRINGSFAGPIDTMVTTNVYSHDHQTLLIPQGTRCLGTVSAVNSTNQQRLFVAFHRCIMPDGYPVDLDKFAGLNQVGETALRDLVNHHYLQIFGASLAVGAIGGLAQIGNSSAQLAYDPSVAIRNGVSSETAQEAMQILNRFLGQLPTFIVREKTRVKIYISADLELPAYDAHVIDPAI